NVLLGFSNRNPENLFGQVVHERDVLLNELYALEVWNLHPEVFVKPKFVALQLDGEREASLKIRNPGPSQLRVKLIRGGSVLRQRALPLARSLTCGDVVFARPTQVLTIRGGVGGLVDHPRRPLKQHQPPGGPTGCGGKRR